MNRYQNQRPHRHNPRHPSDYLTPRTKPTVSTTHALVWVGAWALGFVVGRVL